MTSRVRGALLIVLSLVAAGCRQPDGPMPTPNQNVQDDLVDIGRDLMYIATGSDPAAPQDLSADLRKYVTRDEAMPVVEELSRRTAGAVANTKLPEQTAQRLAHTLWVAIAAREMSDRQVEALQNDTQSMLISVGVADEPAAQVAAQLGEVQRVVTDRQRRWYEWF
jgi:hypothetical protein